MQSLKFTSGVRDGLSVNHSIHNQCGRQAVLTPSHTTTRRSYPELRPRPSAFTPSFVLLSLAPAPGLRTVKLSTQLLPRLVNSEKTSSNPSSIPPRSRKPDLRVGAHALFPGLKPSHTRQKGLPALWFAHEDLPKRFTVEILVL